MNKPSGRWFEKPWPLNTLRPRQNGRHFADDNFKCVFWNENVGISINISLKFVPKGQINNIPSLVQIMACRRPGDKPLSKPMTVSLLTHICLTRPQWVKDVTLETPFDIISPCRYHEILFSADGWLFVVWRGLEGVVAKLLAHMYEKCGFHTCMQYHKETV